MKKRIILLLTMIFSIFIYIDRTVQAAGESSSFGDISVEAIPSPNQLNKKVTYFDLVAPPGSKETLEVKVTNHSDIERTVIPTFNRGFTNRTGTVSYSSKTENKSPGLEYDISELISLSSDKLIIPPKKSVTLKIEVTAPSESYKGILLGALYLKDETPTKDEGNIKNVFAHELGIILQESDKSTSISTEISVDNIVAGQTNHRNTILMTFENKQPGFFSDFSVKGTVKKDGKDDNYLAFSENNFSMAPNSTFTYPISLQELPYEAGNYIVEGIITRDKQEFPFKESFKVTEKEAKTFNETDLSIPKSKWYENFLLVLLLIVGIVLVIGIIIIAIIYVNGKKNKNKYRKKTSKKKRNKRKK